MNPDVLSGGKWNVSRYHRKISRPKVSRGNTNLRTARSGSLALEVPLDLKEVSRALDPVGHMVWRTSIVV